VHQAQLRGLKGGLARALGEQAGALQGASDATVAITGGVAHLQRAL
jgi:butyrate kinase